MSGWRKAQGRERGAARASIASVQLLAGWPRRLLQTAQRHRDAETSRRIRRARSRTAIGRSGLGADQFRRSSLPPELPPNAMVRAGMKRHNYRAGFYEYGGFPGSTGWSG